uniref:Uncharacterized protein n=1 Tax=Oryza glumipatula TaxID=40148 RepID=A0A0D9YRA0_9ORYZ
MPQPLDRAVKHPIATAGSPASRSSALPSPIRSSSISPTHPVASFHFASHRPRHPLSAPPLRPRPRTRLSFHLPAPKHTRGPLAVSSH